MSLEDLINQENGKTSNRTQVNEELNEIMKQNALLRDRMELIEKSQESKNKQTQALIRELEDTKASLNSSNRVLNHFLQQLKESKSIDVDVNEDLSEKIINAIQENYKHNKIKIITKREQELEHSVMKLNEKVKNANKFFFPVLYGAFVAIVGFTVLFLLQGIMGDLFGDSYYPMISTKIEQATGFTEFLWYVAYIVPFLLITATILFILQLFIKKSSDFL